MNEKDGNVPADDGEVAASASAKVSFLFHILRYFIISCKFSGNLNKLCVFFTFMSPQCQISVISYGALHKEIGDANVAGAVVVDKETCNTASIAIANREHVELPKVRFFQTG